MSLAHDISTSGTRRARVMHSVPETPQSVAERMLSHAKGDMEAATKAMVEYAEQHENIRRIVLWNGCRAVLNGIARSDRPAADLTASNDTWNPGELRPTEKAKWKPNAAAFAAAERQKSLGAAHQGAPLLNAQYVINGICKPLREHIGTDVVAFGNTQLEASKTGVRNARFWIAIGEAAGARKVGDAVTTSEALRLRKEADKTPV